VDNLGGRGKSVLVVVAILSSWGLDVQQGFFMMTMKLKSTQAMVEVVAFTTNIVNLVIINPLTHLW
jgi:hypothetical protein